MDEHRLDASPHAPHRSAWCEACAAEGVHPWTVTRGKPPPRDGLEKHQVWVWMAGADVPHYEIRGTGLIWP